MFFQRTAIQTLRIALISAFVFLLSFQPANAHTSEDFADLAETLLPMVVNVSTTQTAPEPQTQQSPFPQDILPQFPPGSPFEDFFNDFFQGHPGFNNERRSQQHAPKQLRKPASLGSGFIVDAKKGYIVTNHHVIKDADEIKIILHNDKTIDAEVVGSDDKTDLAVLQVKTDINLSEAKWGNSDRARVGSGVIAIGNPFGLGGTVTSGIVSARQRDINAGPYDDFIQTDASINRGNSGGPMFNMAGEVIGVNTAIFSPSGGSVGIGFAVPSSLAKGVVEQLIKYGKTRRGWLGVRIQTVTPEIAESLGLKEDRGALVASLTKDGPAEKHGIKPGDVILSFGNESISAMRGLPRIVADSPIAEKIDVLIWRDGREKTITVKLDELKDTSVTNNEESTDTTDDNPSKPKISDKKEFSALGLTLAPLSEARRDRYGISDDATGLMIVDIDQASSAALKGLNAGDIIAEIDQKPVKTLRDVSSAIKTAKKSKRKSILLLLKNGQDIRFVALRLHSE